MWGLSHGRQGALHQAHRLLRSHRHHADCQRGGTGAVGKAAAALGAWHWAGEEGILGFSYVGTALELSDSKWLCEGSVFPVWCVLFPFHWGP